MIIFLVFLVRHSVFSLFVVTLLDPLVCLMSNEGVS